MDTRRLFLLLALGFILLLLWTDWRTEHARPVPLPRQQAVQSSPAATAGGSPVQPGSAPASAPAPVPAVRLVSPAGPTVTIRTDVLELTVALRGAVVTGAALLRYPEQQGHPAPVMLLSPSDQTFLQADPILSGDGLHVTPVYSARASSFTLAPGAQTLRVPLTWSGDGLSVTRTLVLARGSYQVGMETDVANTGKHPRSITTGMRLVGANPETAAHLWDHFLPKYWAFRGPAYYAGGSYEERAAESLPGEPIEKRTSGGWVASVKQYFVAAALPPAKARADLFGRSIDGRGYDLGYRLAPVQILPGRSESVPGRLFLGPKLQGQLAKVAPGFSRTVDYGKARIISAPLFSILSWIHGLLGNWGWSIVLLVLLIKAVFYWPQRISARSMAKMRKLQPRIKHLQERYKDDKQKLSQATMELYRKEGANPVSGCLPMLIQIPIFFGLWYVLIHSVELRQAPWVLWIRDLSAPDPLYILPVLYAVVSLVQFRLQPQAVDNAQARMMMFMPLFFTVLYAVFPSGLVLYYLLNTMLNVAIQWQVNRELGIPMGILPKRRPKAP